jgi:hypothetical protein
MLVAVIDAPAKMAGMASTWKDAHQAKRAQGKGQHHADDRHREGLLPDSHQLIQLTFQTR